MAKKRNDPGYVFEKAKKTPKAKPNKSPSGKTNSVKAVLPTKDGIYKRAKKVPAKPVSKAPVKSKVKKQPKKKVQYSSRAKAEKSMRKGVRRRQKGKGLGNMFDL